jgi:hypothetical protein
MRTVITAACTFALAGSFALSATRAAEPPTQASAAQASSTPAANADHAAGKQMGGTCLKSTGSRIPPKAGQCLLAPGNVYTHKQLETTGKSDAAGALRDVSPILTISHH